MTDTSYLQMVLALILVTGLIVALGYTAKRKQGAEGLMKVMGYQSLGPKKGIAAVKFGREILLVGVTANDLRLLKTYEYSETEHAPSPLSTKAPFPVLTDTLMKLKALKDNVHAAQ